jgi:hypothetical protein
MRGEVEAQSAKADFVPFQRRVSNPPDVGGPSENRVEPENAMSKSEPEAGTRVKFTEDTLGVDLVDGRTIIVPLAWYPRLLHATPEQRANWRVAGAGFGIHWPEIDEDLSTDGLLRGLRAPRGSFTAA